MKRVGEWESQPERRYEFGQRDKLRMSRLTEWNVWVSVDVRGRERVYHECNGWMRRMTGSVALNGQGIDRP